MADDDGTVWWMEAEDPHFGEPLTDAQIAMHVKPRAVVREWRKALAEVESLKAQLERLQGDLRYLINECCGDLAGHTFCESFGCSTLKQLLEGSIERLDYPLEFRRADLYRQIANAQHIRFDDPWLTEFYAAVWSLIEEKP